MKPFLACFCFAAGLIIGLMFAGLHQDYLNERIDKLEHYENWYFQCIERDKR